MTGLPNPFISADPHSAEKAPAAKGRNPDAAGATEFQNSCGGVESRHARSVSLADGSQLSGSTLGLAEIAGVAPGPQETNFIAEIFIGAQKLEYPEVRFDEPPIFLRGEAIEPPPLFMQRAAG